MPSIDKKPAFQDEPKTEKSALRLYQESRLAQKRLKALLTFLPDPVFAFTLDNKVEYINPAFERVFGWTLKEVKGKNINFIPEHLVEQAKQGMKQLYENQTVLDFETQRFTKDGRILDIMINGSLLFDEYNKPAGQVLLLRDMTVEKRMAKSNQIMFRISKALHQYQELGELISLITREIQTLINVEGTFILLADKTKDQLYFFSAQYRDQESEKKFKKIRFSADQGVSGRVFKTGEPLMIPDAAKCPFFLRRVDDETDLVTRNILSVPIKLKDQTIGVVSVVNKNYGEFDTTDTELLSMVAGTIALPIENTRIHEELRKSYQELKTLNQAKDKVINHLAHELKTPVSILDASLKLLLKKLTASGRENPLIEKIVDRGRRNLTRILDIQYEAEDLLKKKDFKAYHILNRLVDACKDELNVLVESETDSADIINRISNTIETLFGPKELQSKTFFPNTYLTRQMDRLKPEFQHRKCRVSAHIHPTDSIFIPVEIFEIITQGIIRNAIEYTPDHGKIEIILNASENGPELIVTDRGIGFTREKLQLIFKNYFSPPDSIDYSTKNPFDFNAGGRGFDLLRIKLFSERYHFKLKIKSTRCGVIPEDTDICPGDIHLCRACRVPEDCFTSGGSTIRIQFNSSG